MEKTIFLKVMGNTPMYRLLDFLVTFKYFDYTARDLAKNSNINYKTICKLLRILERLDMIIFSKKNNSKKYRLNLKNSVVKTFIRFHWLIIKRETHRMLELDKQKIRRKLLVTA